MTLARYKRPGDICGVEAQTLFYNKSISHTFGCISGVFINNLWIWTNKLCRNTSIVRVLPIKLVTVSGEPSGGVSDYHLLENL